MDAAGMASPRLQSGRRFMPGHWHVITTVTHGRLPLFRCERVVLAVLREIRRCEEDGWLQSTAWVLMPDHLHWMFMLTGVQGLDRCMQSMKSRSARAIGKGGPVWQAGYYDHWVRDEHDIRHQAEYILANPVRSGLAQHVGEYPHAWCSWQATPTSHPPPVEPSSLG